MIRNLTIPINYFVLRDCRIAHELDGTDCVETWIEMVLRERLDARPEIGVLAARLDKAKKDVTAAWRAEFAKEDAKAAAHRRIAEGLPREKEAIV